MLILLFGFICLGFCGSFYPLFWFLLFFHVLPWSDNSCLHEKIRNNIFRTYIVRQISESASQIVGESVNQKLQEMRVKGFVNERVGESVLGAGKITNAIAGELAKKSPHLLIFGKQGGIFDFKKTFDLVNNEQ